MPNPIAMEPHYRRIDVLQAALKNAEHAYDRKATVEFEGNKSVLSQDEINAEIDKEYTELRRLGNS